MRNFYSEDHNGVLQNVSTTLVDMADGFRIEKRKILDDNFEDTRPLGLNVESTI